MPATKTAPARQRRPRETTAAAIPQPDAVAEPVRMVGEHKVVADEPALSPLPARVGQQPVTFKKLRVLTLDDGTTTHGCGDCGEFTGTRGEVQKHRYDEHQAPRAGRRAAEPSIPADLSAMTLGELVELSRDAASWGDLITELEVKLDDWRTRALAAESWKRKVTVRFAQLGFTLNEDGD